MLAHSIIKLVPPPGKSVAGKILFKGRNFLEVIEKGPHNILGKVVGVVSQDQMTRLDPLRKNGNQLTEVVARA